MLTSTSATRHLARSGIRSTISKKCEGLSDTFDSLASHRLNEVIKALTVISVIILPLTLITSVTV